MYTGIHTLTGGDTRVPHYFEIAGIFEAGGDEISGCAQELTRGRTFSTCCKAANYHLKLSEQKACLAGDRLLRTAKY